RKSSVANIPARVAPAISGHWLSSGGDPTVVTLSWPLRLTAPPLNWPKAVVLASIAVANVAVDCWLKLDPPLRARLWPGSIITVPLLLAMDVGPPPPPSCRVGPAMSTTPPALMMLARRWRFPPPPATVFRWPLLVRVTPAQQRMLNPLPASPSVMVPAFVRLFPRVACV